MNNPSFDPSPVFDRLQQGRSHGGGFEGVSFNDTLAILTSKLKRPKGVGDFDWQSIVRKSLLDATAASVVDKVSFQRAHKNAISAHARTPEKRFVVATTLSTRYGSHLKTLRADGATFTFSRRLPQKFDRTPLEKIPGYPSAPEPDDYVRVRVAVRARSHHGAREKALRALDLVRGLWNFSQTRLTIARLSLGRRPTPVAEIRIGPTQTIHLANGKLASEIYFYDPLFVAYDVRHDAAKWAELLKEFDLLRKLLKERIPYRAKLEDAFVRYAAALDGIHFQATFLQLWGLLELLTNTTGGPYDKTIERTANLYTEVLFNRLLLDHLRDSRNRWVHMGASSTSEDVEDSVFLLKRYVDDALRFHFQFAGRFRSLEEAAAFLDLPWQLEDLKRRRTVLNSAIKFRTPRN